MHPPVLAEPVRPARLPSVVVAIRPVVPLHDRGVDRPARPPTVSRAPATACHVPSTTAVTIATTRPLSRSLWTVAYLRSAGAWRCGSHRPSAGRAGRPRRPGLAVDVIDGRRVGRVFVAGQQHVAPPRPCGRTPPQRSPRRSRSSGAGDHRQDQPVLGVVGDVVPPVPLLVIVRVERVAVGLLLEDERPLLVELDLTGLGGKV